MADGVTEAEAAKCGAESPAQAALDEAAIGVISDNSIVTCPDFGGCVFAFQMIKLPPTTADTRNRAQRQ